MNLQEQLVPRRHRPPRMRAHAFERTRVLPVERGAAWRWLNTPETFTRQVWPYRVEFVEGSGVGGASGFAPGVLNTHHGPFLNCAGVVTRVDEDPDAEELVRDLHYFYGAFIGSPRLVRPTLLRFSARGEGDATSLTVRVESDVAPWFHGVWSRAQVLFWAPFFASAKRGARRATR